MNEQERETFISFLECELRGKWKNSAIDYAFSRGADPEDIINQNPPSAERYLCNGDDCELWIVRPDGLRRAFHFKKQHMLIIRSAVVSFNQSSIIEELSVDDDQKI